MKRDIILSALAFGCAIWFAYSIVTLIFAPNAVALIGLPFGAIGFLWAAEGINE